METWIEELAAELGEDPLSHEEVERVLEVAREVAHRVERKITPLAAFLLGSVVGRAEGGGMARDRALADAFETLRRLLPAEPPASEEVAATPGDSPPAATASPDPEA